MSKAAARFRSIRTDDFSSPKQFLLSDHPWSQKPQQGHRRRELPASVRHMQVVGPTVCQELVRLLNYSSRWRRVHRDSWRRLLLGGSCRATWGRMGSVIQSPPCCYLFPSSTCPLVLYRVLHSKKIISQNVIFLSLFLPINHVLKIFSAWPW